MVRQQGSLSDPRHRLVYGFVRMESDICTAGPSLLLSLNADLILFRSSLSESIFANLSSVQPNVVEPSDVDRCVGENPISVTQPDEREPL